MYLLILKYDDGSRNYYGPFDTEDKARNYTGKLAVEDDDIADDYEVVSLGSPNL